MILLPTLLGLTKLGLMDLVVAWMIALVWAVHWLEAATGMPRIPEITRAEWDVAADEIVSAESGQITPKVSIVVPARNEAQTIEPALRSLRHLDYPNYELIAVNDRSEDATGEIMERLAAEEGGAVRVVHISELPPGWLGKTHAMWAGAKAGTGEWMLFTDADVVFRGDAVRRAVAYAETERADHVVLFPTMLTHTSGERMMISLFQALIGFGHRPWKVADPEARDHIGVGAFNMIRRSAYEKIGTYERLRLAVMDDMQLGQLAKKAGFRQRCVFGKNLARIHWADGAMGVVRNVTKNFFAYMRFNPWVALAAVGGLLITNVLPFAGLFVATGWSRVGYAVALLCIFAIYAGMAPKSGIRARYFLTHPVSASLFAYAILLSAATTLRHGGIVWRGTLYPLEELRRAQELGD